MRDGSLKEVYGKIINKGQVERKKEKLEKLEKIHLYSSKP